MANCMEEFFKHFEIETNVVERITRFADTIRTRSKLNSTMNVLDFGCERGLVGLSLIKDSKKMTFLDPSKSAIEQVQKGVEYLNAENYEIVNKKIEEYSGEKFDLIFASICLHHVEDYKGALEKMHGLLNPGGQLIIIEIYTGVIPDHVPIPHHGLEPNVLVSALTEKDFKDIKWEDFGSFEHLNQKVPIYLVTAKV